MVRAYFELVRPANVVTAWADILAGAAIAVGVGVYIENQDNTFWAFRELISMELGRSLIWLLLSTTGLYAGGVTMNDVFDAELDAKERPERAIPSGRASKTGATIFGLLLLGMGIGAAFQANMYSGWIAVSVGLLALVYDRFSKHHVLLGPMNMGFCRAGNLLLGLSILPAAFSSIWMLAILPLVYISAITLVSQGEVNGGSSKIVWLAIGLILLIVAGLLGMVAFELSRFLSMVGFVLLFVWLVLPSFLKAARAPEAANVRRAVGAGIMGLIPLNASIAAGFAGWPLGIIVLLLLPISIGLARLFAVT